MRYLIAVALLLVCLIPASAQSSFAVEFYEFENVIASMAYTGTWSTSTATGTVGGVGRASSVVGSSVSFYSAGDTVVIWRFMRSTGNLSKMDVCINGASCVNVANEATSSNNFWYPYVLTVTPGALVSITHTSGLIVLDSLMILSSTGGTFPTPVPTATIIPSSTPAPTATPASTTTPQPTPTPQPTSTPQPSPTAMSVIVAIDPQRSYSSESGQITAFDYIASAGDVHIANLLTAIFISQWGMFVFACFVLVRFRK